MVRDGDTNPGFVNDDFDRTYNNSSHDFGHNSTQETQSFSNDYGNMDDFKNSNTILTDSSKSPEISNAWLVIIKGRNAGREYFIPPQGKPSQRRIALGRSSINDIVLDDHAVSDEHAFIVCENNTYLLGDAGSLNGTMVNDRKISGFRKLVDGDNLSFGETEMQFKYISVSMKSTVKNKSKTKKISPTVKSAGKTTKKADTGKPKNTKFKSTVKIKKIKSKEA